MKSNKQINSYVESFNFNPWFNLSVEEYLADTIKPNQVILYLWQNIDTVVIGSNQNPWKECNIEKMKAEGVSLARRSSGGGAVYHDLGNLNFTFIVGKELYNLEKQLEVILRAVNSFGLNAYFSGRNDILIDGKKFSGNAYFFGDVSSYHHGTILIDSDIGRLSHYLNPSMQKILSKGIDSIKSRVVNLHSICNQITVQEMKTALLKAFSRVYGDFLNHSQYAAKEDVPHAVMQLYEQHSSWQWLYGESPSFDACFEDTFDWGEIQIGLNLVDARINNAKVYSDALNIGFVEKLSRALLGKKLEAEEIQQTIKFIEADQEEKRILDDISKMKELNPPLFS